MTSADVVPGPGDGRTPVILIVEDEVLVRFSTAELLRDEGYVVLEAVDASEALSLLATGHPLDLVLTDIRMPGKLDGLAMTCAIKEVRPNLPVVLFSSHLPANTAHAGDAFLAKPYEAAELFEIVKKTMGEQWYSKRSGPGPS